MELKHLGDITGINGAEIEPVDCITFGSPCQNLSQAGNRKGLSGSESRLFFEAVRIIREMREATHGVYPTFAVWENVRPFASNNGEDFRTVLESLARIAEPNAVIPRPPKWENAGAIAGDGWSVAWRMFDAKYFKTPQRRERICVLVDYGGHRSPQILFEQECLPWHIETVGAKREASPGRVDGCTEEYYTAGGFGGYVAGFGTLRASGGDSGGAAKPCFWDASQSLGTLTCRNSGGAEDARQTSLHARIVSCIENHATDNRVTIQRDWQTVTARMGTGGNNVPLVSVLCEN